MKSFEADWFSKRSDVVYLKNNKYFISIETSYTELPPPMSARYTSMLQQTKAEAANKIMGYLNKVRTNNYVSFFQLESYYMDTFPGARLKLLFSIEKEQLDSFETQTQRPNETEKKRINLKDFLKLKFDVESWKYK